MARARLASVPAARRIGPVDTVTHAALDWCTTYGTLLLYPVSRHRFALDAVAIVDPLVTAPLAAGVVAAILLRRRGRPASRRYAAGALAFTAAYLAAGALLSARCASFARCELERAGVEPASVRAVPTLPVGIVRVIAARGGDRTVYKAAMSPFSSRPLAFRTLPWPGDPAADAALLSERGRTFEWFSSGMVSAAVSVTDAPDGARAKEVVLASQLYGLVTRPKWTPFSARFEIGPSGEIVRATTARGFGSAGGPGQDGEGGVSLRRELAAGLALLFER